MRSGSTDFYQVVIYIDSIIFIIYSLLPIKQFFQHNLHGSISDNFQTIQTSQFLFQQLGFTGKVLRKCQSYLTFQYDIIAFNGYRFLYRRKNV